MNQASKTYHYQLTTAGWNWTRTDGLLDTFTSGFYETHTQAMAAIKKDAARLNVKPLIIRGW